jgi:uncharacterized protein YyaL (SSP411 family)
MDEQRANGIAERVTDGITDGAGEREHNALGGAASAYLRSAMHQPVDWMEWGDAAFARAAREDKPILLDIGAVWCHWCHVMDRESYDDATTAQIINEKFVAVKVDRDERPDVDTRYQAAISAISGQAGWPLTAFLTPEGKPYFGGTYFPPEDRHGRPGLQRVLLTMADAFASRRVEVEESAGSVMNAIEHNEAFSGQQGELAPELLEKMLLAALKSADLRNGGFGAQPKFPHSSALDLLIDVAQRPPGATQVKIAGTTVSIAEAAKRVATVALEKMARGGVYDHLAGGFHRYSVDEHWVVPHFEKMAYDNSELLKNYVHAYQAFGNEEFARVARDIMRWMDEWLTDAERGGFYASQDADFSLDDDGDYFTWTRDEAAEALTPEELRIAADYYDIGEIGDMRHNVAKNVLHVKHSLDVVARKSGVSVAEAKGLLDSAKRKLYAARLNRPTPYVDRTMYVGWNAMCISAYLAAGRVLGDEAARAFAIKSLDRVLHDACRDGMPAHVVAYGEPGIAAETVRAVLDDYVFLGHAALDAWEATGDRKYYDAAKLLTEAVVERFFDPEGSGFFDTPKPGEGERRLGALGARRKPLQDSPTPAGNPMAVMLLIRMSDLSGSVDYARKAQSTLEMFAAVVEHFGLYAATYALALQRYLQPPVQVCIIGDDIPARELEDTALRGFAVNKSVIRLAHVEKGKLPPELDSTLPELPQMDGSFAVVCSAGICQQPVQSPQGLVAALGR